MLGGRDQGRNLDSSKQILNQYLDRWLEICAKPRLRAKSLQDYEGLLRRYVRPQLGTKTLSTVSAFDIQTLYRELLNRSLSARSIRYTHAVLRSALKQAVRWSLILANPADLVDLPRKDERRFGVLSVEQARTFIKAITGHPYEPLFALAMTTGMPRPFHWQRGSPQRSSASNSATPALPLHSMSILTCCRICRTRPRKRFRRC